MDAKSIAISSYTRPIRVAIILPEPVGVARFKSVVRTLCGVRGGTRSLILGGSIDRVIGEPWMPIAKAFDPDIFFLAAPLWSTARANRLADFLDRMGIVPRWIARYGDGLEFGNGWRPQDVEAAAELDQRSLASVADDLKSPTAVDVVVHGLRPKTIIAADATKRRLTSVPLNSMAPRSAVWRAAAGIPGYALTAVSSARFYFHADNSLDAAQWLWNIRAIHGAIRHGPSDGLRRALRLRLRASAPLVVLAHEHAEEALAAIPDVDPSSIKIVAVQDHNWRAVFRLSPPADFEQDDIRPIEGVIQMPRRAASASAGSRTGVVFSSPSDGAYALETSFVPQGNDGMRYSTVSRLSLRDIVLAPLSSGTWAAVTARNSTASRPRPSGNTTILLRRASPRTVSIRLPSITEVANALDPDVTFALSDKGHYSRWIVERMGGLAEVGNLLRDPRGRVVIDAFGEHHVPGRRQSGSYRRFLTLDEMREQFKARRARGDLLKRFAVPDGVWFSQWIDRLVLTDVLRLGIWGRCRECLAGSFLPLGLFDRHFGCPRCGSNQETPPRPLLGYRLAEVVHQFLVNDCDVDVLALDALRRRSAGAFTYGFAHEVRGPGNLRNEFDFLAIADGSVVVGESKKNGSFDAGDFDVLKRVAKRSGAKTIALASGTECNGRCGDECSAATTGMVRSSDDCLARDAVNTGPRDRAENLRLSLGQSTAVTVLCAGELWGGATKPAHLDTVQMMLRPRK